MVTQTWLSHAANHSGAVCGKAEAPVGPSAYNDAATVLQVRRKNFGAAVFVLPDINLLRVANPCNCTKERKIFKKSPLVLMLSFLQTVAVLGAIARVCDLAKSYGILAPMARRLWRGAHCAAPAVPRPRRRACSAQTPNPN